MDHEPNKPEQRDAAPTEPSDLPLGLLAVGRDGIELTPFDSPDEPILLKSDQSFEDIIWALPDQRGGLIFQHEVTPPPWPPGAVLWLRAGAAHPEVLIPPEEPWEASTFPRAGIVPIGMATTRDGRALFVYAVEDRDPSGYNYRSSPTRIMVADLDGGGAPRELAVVQGTIDENGGRYAAVTSGAYLLLIDGVDADWDEEEDDWEEGRCLTVTLLRVDDGSWNPRIPATSNCWPFGSWLITAVSHDGSSLAALWLGGPEQGMDPELNISVMDVSTGAVVQQATIQTQGGLDRFWLSSGPSGWVVGVHTPSEVVLVDIDGNELRRIDSSTVSDKLVGPTGGIALWDHAVPYHHPFDLASDASLGSGSGERPCQPFTGDLPDQDLPEPVAVTRQELFDLAAACDYEGLASLANEHAATVFLSAHGHGVTVGDDPYLGSEADVVSSWIADGLSPPAGFGVSGEPLETLAALLGTTPAYLDDAADLPAGHPQPRGSVWVWPGVYVEPGSQGTTTYRIGIVPDGTWLFFMAGDFG